MTELTHEDILVVLIEEAAEVIHAATKCLRFGYDHYEPGYGNNRTVLSKEVGELRALTDELILDQQTMDNAYRIKIDRVKKLKERFAQK